MKKCLIVSTVSRQFTLFERGNIEVLKELGYEVHCVANYSDATEEVKELGIIEHNIDIQRSPFSLKNIKAYKQLKNIINSDKYDLIHCHSPMGGVLARLAAKKTRKINHTRVIYTAHGFHFFKGAPLINWMLYYPVEKCLSKYTDCLITINQEDYNIASKKFKARKVELVNGIGVDENKFNFEMSDEEKHKLRESLGLKDDNFVIIYVAELSKRKNQGMLIEAIKKIIDKGNNNVKVLLPGKDSLNGKYQKLVEKYNLQEHIKFLGFRQDIPQLMKISNLCVSTSKQEGLPVNIMEAMFCNIPIIATDCRGNRDLIQNNKNGCIVNIGNIKALEDKILYTIKTRMKENNNVEKYTKLVIKDKMKKIYLHTTNNNKKVLFVHDGPIYRDNNGAYYAVDYTNTMVDRYLTLGKTLAIMTRVKSIEVEEACKLNKLTNNNLEIIEIPDYKKIKTFFINRKKASEIIKKSVKKYNICIIRVPSFLSNRVFKEVCKNKVNYIVEVVACAWEGYRLHSLLGKIIAPYMYIKTKNLIGKSSHVMYISEFLKNRYPTKGKYVICSDVEIKHFSKDILKERQNKILKTNPHENKIILATIGALNMNYKGQQYVIKALRDFKKYKIEYLLIGGGDKEYLSRIAKKNDVNVKFLGTLPHEQVFEILKNVDIYVQPSKTEGISRSIIEAMSLGCPVIGSNVGGIPELVEEEMLFKKGNISDIKNKIQKCLNDLDILKKHSKINYEKSKQFELEKLNLKKENFYKEFCD